MTWSRSGTRSTIALRRSDPRKTIGVNTTLKESRRPSYVRSPIEAGRRASFLVTLALAWVSPLWGCSSDTEPTVPDPNTHGVGGHSGAGGSGGSGGTGSVKPPCVVAANREVRDCVYATVDGIELALDLYLPVGSGPHPLIIWIHGGAWVEGDKDLPFDHLARKQVERGFALASINYRFSFEQLFPAQINDCKTAVRWLRANAGAYGLDSSTWIAWGASAGGHLAALLGTSGDVTTLEDTTAGYEGESSRVQAVIDWYGPTDFSQMGGGHDSPNSPESKLLGCAVPTCPDKVQEANPITYITADDPPFLIQHGTEDPAVPFSQSQLLHDALLAAGLSSSFHPVQGANHGGPEFASDEVRQIVENFLAEVTSFAR